MIAGPGTMAVIIGFSTEIAEYPHWQDQVATFFMMTLAIVFCSVVCWAVMRSADFCGRKLGPSGTIIISKLMGFCWYVSVFSSSVRVFAPLQSAVNHNAF